MMSKKVALDEITLMIKKGVTPKYTEISSDTTVKVINQKCIRDFQVNYELCRNHDLTKRKIAEEKYLTQFDVLINSTGTGTLGRVAQFLRHGSITVDSHVCIVRPNPELIDPLYFGYLIKSKQSIIEGLYTGSTGQTELDKNALSILELEIIEDRETQKRIGEIFQYWDDKLTNNTAMNATLEKIAQRIFKSWFIDFDPVTANAESVQFDGLSPEIQALFPNEFEESELGMIPKGWEAVNFGSQLIHTIGGDWGKEVIDEKHTENVRIIRGTDFNNLLKGNDSAVPTRFVEAKKLKTRKLESNDIIIEVSGGSPTQPTGRSMRISENVLDLLALPVEPASFCRLFRPASAEVSTLLSHHLTRLYNEGGTWKYQNQSTGISNFQTKYFLENELVVMPSEAVLRQFHKTIKPIVDKISLNGSQINSLSKIRDKLLPRLISGNITIQKAEELLEEAS
jgi:type I restriction enzyme S subunit